MYSFLRHCLFRLRPERAHHVSLKLLQLLHRLKLLNLIFESIPASPRKVMNLDFPNPVGLAAGLDKNGDYIDALAALGFGFIEVGTVTPQPQAGNPKPRLFRYLHQEAFINRMGFNNKGVDHLVKQLESMKYKGIIGVNIGKNRTTSLENALDDYLYVFRRVWRKASYVAINISSPNTEKLRELQQANFLQPLLSALKKEQALIQQLHQKYVPLVVKISPDLTRAELETMADILLAEKIDGVIATNTTLQREGLNNVTESGGLSGKPLTRQSTAILSTLRLLLKNQIPIIASGGIMDKASAQEKWEAGASLLQLYTGFIYKGPSLIADLNDFVE